MAKNLNDIYASRTICFNNDDTLEHIDIFIKQSKVPSAKIKQLVPSTFSSSSSSSTSKENSNGSKCVIIPESDPSVKLSSFKALLDYVSTKENKSCQYAHLSFGENRVPYQTNTEFWKDASLKKKKIKTDGSEATVATTVQLSKKSVVVKKEQPLVQPTQSLTQPKVAKKSTASVPAQEAQHAPLLSSYSVKTGFLYPSVTTTNDSLNRQVKKEKEEKSTSDFEFSFETAKDVSNKQTPMKEKKATSGTMKPSHAMESQSIVVNQVPSNDYSNMDLGGTLQDFDMPHSSFEERQDFFTTTTRPTKVEEKQKNSTIINTSIDNHIERKNLPLVSDVKYEKGTDEDDEESTQEFGEDEESYGDDDDDNEYQADEEEQEENELLRREIASQWDEIEKLEERVRDLEQQLRRASISHNIQIAGWIVLVLALVATLLYTR